MPRPKPARSSNQKSPSRMLRSDADGSPIVDILRHEVFSDRPVLDGVDSIAPDPPHVSSVKKPMSINSALPNNRQLSGRGEQTSGHRSFTGVFRTSTLPEQRLDDAANAAPQ